GGQQRRRKKQGSHATSPRECSQAYATVARATADAGNFMAWLFQRDEARTEALTILAGWRAATAIHETGYLRSVSSSSASSLSWSSCVSVSVETTSPVCASTWTSM